MLEEAETLPRPENRYLRAKWCESGFFVLLLSIHPRDCPGRKNKPGIVTVPINTSYEIPAGVISNPEVCLMLSQNANKNDIQQMIEDVRQARHRRTSW